MFVLVTVPTQMTYLFSSFLTLVTQPVDACQVPPCAISVTLDRRDNLASWSDTIPRATRVTSLFHKSKNNVRKTLSPFMVFEPSEMPHVETKASQIDCTSGLNEALQLSPLFDQEQRPQKRHAFGDKEKREK